MSESLGNFELRFLNLQVVEQYINISLTYYETV